MKNSGKCEKCDGSNIIRIPDKLYFLQKVLTLRIAKSIMKYRCRGK